MQSSNSEMQITHKCISHMPMNVWTEEKGWRIGRAACQLPAGHDGKHRYKTISWDEEESDEYILNERRT